MHTYNPVAGVPKTSRYPGLTGQAAQPKLTGSERFVSRNKMGSSLVKTKDADLRPLHISFTYPIVFVKHKLLHLGRFESCRPPLFRPSHRACPSSSASAVVALCQGFSSCTSMPAASPPVLTGTVSVSTVLG